METDRWLRLRDLFVEARALDEAARGAFLEKACSDPELRNEVLEMLVVAETATLEVEAKLLSGESEVAVPRSSPMPEAFGPYRVRRLLARGGMSDVYLADSQEPAGRPVAVKVLRQARMSSDDASRRFRQEREILSRLDHPGIASVLDDGVARDGGPYLVIEYVDGTPLLEHTVRANAPLDQRIRLFLDVCGAVDFAHQRQILHRDLKSSNVLVTPELRVVLLDFGIGKLLDPGDMDEVTVVTPPGIRLLTPANAAPEQVAGQPPSLRTDIYALGLILYELLAEKPALDPHGLSWFEWERRVLEEDPSPPSTAGGVDPTVWHSAEATARVTLDGVTLRCLEKDPERRFGTVRELATAVRGAGSEVLGLDQS